MIQIEPYLADLLTVRLTVNLASRMKAAYKKMDATKEKFRKAFEDQEKANAAYSKAENDGNVTKNEVANINKISVYISRFS